MNPQKFGTIQQASGFRSTRKSKLESRITFGGGYWQNYLRYKSASFWS